MRPRAGTMGVRVVDAHQDRVGRLARPRRPAVVADVADDHRAVAEGELRAMVLADLQSLDEPERARSSQATASRTSG